MAIIQRRTILNTNPLTGQPMASGNNASPTIYGNTNPLQASLSGQSVTPMASMSNGGGSYGQHLSSTGHEHGGGGYRPNGANALVDIGGGSSSSSPSIAPYANQEAYNNAQNAQNQLENFYAYVAGQSGGNGNSNTNTTTTTTGGGVPVEAPNQSMDYMAQLSAMLQAQQAQQQAQLQANQAAHQALVEQAYNNNLNSLNSMYGQMSSNLGNTYNNALGQLESNYNYAADQINDNADNALREAYVNRMLAQKNLAQQLNASGLTGGAAESVVAQLLNNYGNARNNIEVQRGNDLASLLNAYQNNTQSAGQQYAQALNDLAMNNYNYQHQLQNDLANGVIGTYNDLYGALNSGVNSYANAMQGLAANQVGNAADLAAQNYSNYLDYLYAINKPKTTTTTTTNTSNKTVDSSVINQIRQMIASNGIPDTINKLMSEYGGDYDSIMELLQQAGVQV